MLISALSLSSCKKFLEEDPKSFLAPTNYYKTPQDALSALVGAYDALGNNSSTYTARPIAYLTWFCSDEALPPILAPQKQLDNFTYGADHADIGNLWNQIYDAIGRANTVLEKVPPIAMDNAQKEQILAEARFLRGYHYFNLVRLWGKVPVVTKPITVIDDALIAQSSLAEVYTQIISDLESAAAVLPNTIENGRAAKGAALGILSKVYLTRASSEAAQTDDYKKCADLAKQVIDLGPYRLMTDYQKAIGGEDEFNPESIFEWQADRVLLAVGEQSVFGQFTLPRDIVGLVPEAGQTGESNIASEVGFFNKYNNLDYRKESTFITQGTNRQGNVVTWQQFTYPFPAPAWKFVNKNATTRNAYAFSANIVILRLADLYLARAEALNEIGGPTTDAYTMINAIRARARARNGASSSAFPADLSGVNKDQFRDAVIEERAIELGFEGQRWFDLVRTKRFVSVMKAAHPEYPVEAKHNLFPIPANEIRLNTKLIQNPGW